MFYCQASDECRTQDVEVGTSEIPEDDHHTAADNPGVVMNEIEPCVNERRPSSDTSGIICISSNLILLGRHQADVHVYPKRPCISRTFFTKLRPKIKGVFGVLKHPN